MENKHKIILDLCGGTGAWSKDYKDAGYDVRLITLPEDDVKTYQPSENAYGILAAPPCTMFSLARQNAKTPRDFKKGMSAVIDCLGIIWKCRYINKLAFWALENPTGYLRQFLGKPAFTFQPYEFGDPSKKKTDLWGYFNNPKKNPIPKPNYPRKGSASWSGQYSTPGQKERATTPAKFAKAFFEANK